MKSLIINESGDTLNSILENSALMGLIGVIIGSILSFLGIMYSEHIKLKTFDKEKKYLEEEKRKSIYIKFLDLINQYRNIIYAQVIDYKEFSTKEEKVELLKNLSSVLAELDLYAPKEISSKCRKLYYSVFKIITDSNEFQAQYDDIVKLLKEK